MNAQRPLPQSLGIGAKPGKRVERLGRARSRVA
jgi:hypothetical protein